MIIRIPRPRKKGVFTVQPLTWVLKGSFSEENLGGEWQIEHGCWPLRIKNKLWKFGNEWWLVRTSNGKLKISDVRKRSD